MVEALNTWYKLPKSGVERMFVIAEDNAQKPLGIVILGQGSVEGMYETNRELGIALLLMGAVNFTVFHNHPSGNLKPSEDDMTRTQEIQELANMITMEFFDSVIISKNGYYLQKGKELCKVD